MPPRGYLFVSWTLLSCLAAAIAGEPDSQPASQPAGMKIEGLVVNHLGAGVPGARIRAEAVDALAGARPLAQARSNQTGDIVLILPKDTRLPVRIRVEREGYKPYTQTLEPTGDEEAPFIDITLEGAARLRGKVLARETDRPIAGAIVRCETGGREIESTTDQKGAYTIEDVVRGPAALQVNAEGFAILRQQIKVESDDPEEVLELSPERPVEFTLITDSGKPADKVLIEAVIEPVQLYLSALTDDNGKAMLRGVGVDAESISVRLSGDRYVHNPQFLDPIQLAASRPADESPAASAPAGTPPVSSEPVRRRLTIQLGAMIRGTVVDATSGEPIVGVRVIAGTEVRSTMPMIWTSLDGTYELRGLPPGQNVISFQHDVYATAIREITLAAEQTMAVDEKMEAGEAIGGKVVDEKGKPVSSAWVTAESWRGYKTLGVRAITGDDGTFSFPHVPAGQIAFSVMCGNFEPVRGQVLSTGRSDYTITLKAAAPAAPREAPRTAEKVKPGDIVPEMSLTALDGTTYKLSALRGKYVFLDCWASWCGPCMAEVPNMKALREAMKNSPNFVMIGINLDGKEEDCRKAVQKTGMDWPQVSGPKSGAEDAFETLDGFSIPYTCLIGPDGRMLAQRLRGEGVVDDVRKHMKWYEEPTGHKPTSRPGIPEEQFKPKDEDKRKNRPYESSRGRRAT